MVYSHSINSSIVTEKVLVEKIIQYSLILRVFLSLEIKYVNFLLLIFQLSKSLKIKIDVNDQYLIKIKKLI